MSWNYRVVRDEHGSFGIHEAYYDGDGRVRAVTVAPIELHDETLEELRVSYERIGEALRKPVLEAADFTKK